MLTGTASMTEDLKKYIRYKSTMNNELYLGKCLSVSVYGDQCDLKPHDTNWHQAEFEAYHTAIGAWQNMRVEWEEEPDEGIAENTKTGAA